LQDSAGRAPRAVLAPTLEARGPMFTSSGDMRLEFVAEVVATGVHYISAGALTQSAHTLDMGARYLRCGKPHRSVLIFTFLRPVIIGRTRSSPFQKR
jgi:Quinolinate phosphoribosyl transferase, C-terminal domain